MWRVGETYVEPGGGFSVEVLAATANGFQLQIVVGNPPLDPVFEDGFE